MKRKTIIASLAAAALVATAASAHAGWGKDEHRGFSGAEHAEHIAERISEKLDLTDDQEMQVRTIVADHADKLVEQIKNASQNASEKFAADELSEADAALIVQSFADIRERRMNELPSLISAVHAVLTPQQRQQASEMLAERGSDWIGHGFRDGHKRDGHKRGRHHGWRWGW